MNGGGFDLFALLGVQWLGILNRLGNGTHDRHLVGSGLTASMHSGLRCVGRVLRTLVPIMVDQETAAYDSYQKRCHDCQGKRASRTAEMEPNSPTASKR